MDLKASDLAKLCNVSKKTIHNWVERYKLPSYRTPGGHLRFDRHKVRDWLYQKEMPVPVALKDVG